MIKATPEGIKKFSTWAEACSLEELDAYYAVMKKIYQAKFWKEYRPFDFKK